MLTEGWKRKADWRGEREKENWKGSCSRRKTKKEKTWKRGKRCPKKSTTTERNSPLWGKCTNTVVFRMGDGIKQQFCEKKSVHCVSVWD